MSKKRFVKKSDPAVPPRKEEEAEKDDLLKKIVSNKEAIEKLCCRVEDIEKYLKSKGWVPVPKDSAKVESDGSKKVDFVLTDGPHIMWKYWDYKFRFWRGPTSRITTALAAVGGDYNLVEAVAVWVERGRVLRVMTPEEVERFLP